MAAVVMASTRRVNVGIVGVGGMGHVHAENLARNIPGTSLVAIADVNMERAKTMAARLAVTEVFSEYQELIKNPAVEAVVVAVPTFWKQELIISALEAGKHVFTGKPLALSVGQADEMVRAVEMSGKTFQVGYMRRFDPSYMRAKEAIDAGEVGRIQMVTARSRELLIGMKVKELPFRMRGWFADPKLGGSSLLDVASHDYDVIRWLSGSEVSRVYAEAVNLVYKYEGAGEGENYDNAIVTMRLSNGAVGYAEMGIYNLYGYDTAAEVLGTEGAVTVQPGSRTSALVLKEKSVSNEYQNFSDVRFAQAYRDELVDFADCVVRDKEPKVTASDGRAAVEIALAAVQSAKESKPVTLGSR
jgi:predicted dehydrogenase